MKLYSICYTLNYIMEKTEIAATNYTDAYLRAVYSLPSAAVIVEVMEKAAITA